MALLNESTDSLVFNQIFLFKLLFILSMNVIFDSSNYQEQEKNKMLLSELPQILAASIK